MTRNQLLLMPLLVILIFVSGIAGCGTQVPSGHKGVFYYKFSCALHKIPEAVNLVRGKRQVIGIENTHAECRNNLHLYADLKC